MKRFTEQAAFEKHTSAVEELAGIQVLTGHVHVGHGA